MCVCVCASLSQFSWRAMQQMTQRLIKRLSALGQYEEAVAALTTAAALERPAAALKNKASASGQRSDVLSVCDDAFVLAQQLTHIELVRDSSPLWHMACVFVFCVCMCLCVSVYTFFCFYVKFEIPRFY